MKNILKYSGWLIAAALGITLLVVWTQLHHDHDHAHEHDETHEEVLSVGDIKEVILNEAQYKATDIQLGGFARKNMGEVLKVSGYTKLPPQNKAAVSVQLSGIIKQIQVVEGQYVKAGQLLANLQSLDYNNLRLEREKLTEQLSTAQASLEYLKLEYARQKELSDENVSAKKIFEKVSADLKREEGKIKSLTAQIGILSQNIEMGGNSASPMIPVTAPISGYISKIEVNIGTTASSGMMLFEIVDNSKIHIDLQVYEKDIYKMKVGQKIRFLLTNQNGQELSGTVFGVGQALDPDTKTIAIHAEIDNSTKALVAGMYVNAVVDLGSQEVEVLPSDAVVKAEGREFIFVWEETVQEHAHKGEAVHETEHHFQRIEVKTGASLLGFVQITPLQTFKNKDKIVTAGAFYLQSHLQKMQGGGGHGHAH